MAGNLLKLYVDKLPILELIDLSSNPRDALELLRTRPVDLLFLDIQMPEMTGLELLSVMQKKPLVIITTAFSDFALESYELDVVDYLKKPITFERFLKAVNKVEQRMQTAEVTKEKIGEPEYIFFKDGTRFVKVMISEILFIEGLKNYVTIHTVRQKVVSLQRLRTLQDQLSPEKFIRVHNSYIVSKSAISSVKDSEIYVGSKKIPIGETYFKSFMDFIDNYHIR
jgi:DNA-binding LytR/AlgR family response regulator